MTLLRRIKTYWHNFLYLNTLVGLVQLIQKPDPASVYYVLEAMRNENVKWTLSVGFLHLLHHEGPVVRLQAEVQQPEAAGGSERVDSRPARHYLVTTGRLEPSHWSRSTQILGSDWWTPHYAGSKVFAITTNLKANKIHLCVFGCLLVCSLLIWQYGMVGGHKCPYMP